MVASIFYVLLLSFFRSNNNAKIVLFLGLQKKIVLFLELLYML